MKIKPAGKIAIFLLLGVTIFFAVKRFMPAKTAEDSATTIENTNTPNTTTRNETKAGDNTSATESRDFNFTPEKPVNGSLRGVVEVGATGFNSFVINMDKQKRWEIVSKDFGESLAYEGLATTEDIRAGLKKYLSNMFAKGVDKRDMHFVISSGAQKEPKTGIISNELKKIGYVVNNVTPEQEGKYALRATIPPSFNESSFMVDIGSGNTKISWYENGNLKAMEVAGSKYYDKNKSDDAIYNEVKGQVSKIPQANRNVCFIIGGVPFTLAKQHRQNEERYTVLKAPDSYKGEDKKMSSGLNIYKAIADATKTDTFVFDWDANFTIGFLLNLP
ncbi:MAG: hypothetical protein WKF97_14550 [Chitinophagaceae bacterium]